MIITIKEIEIELSLSELNELPQNVRQRCLENIAKETDIEDLDKQIATKTATLGKRRGRKPKVKDD